MDIIPYNAYVDVKQEQKSENGSSIRQGMAHEGEIASEILSLIVILVYPFTGRCGGMVYAFGSNSGVYEGPGFAPRECHTYFS